MSENFLISPLWTAAGWTMLHSLWIGMLIGLMSAIARRLLKPSRPELRYVVAVVCLVMLAFSPAVIFVQVFEQDTEQVIVRGRTVTSTEPIRGALVGIIKTPHSGVDRPWHFATELAEQRSAATRSRRLGGLSSLFLVDRVALNVVHTGDRINWG